MNPKLKLTIWAFVIVMIFAPTLAVAIVLGAQDLFTHFMDSLEKIGTTVLPKK